MKNNWIKKVTLFMVSQTVSLLGSMLVYAIMWHITLTTQSGVMMIVMALCSFCSCITIITFCRCLGG